VSVTLTDAAAQAFGQDPELLARLDGLITERAGTAPTRVEDGDVLTLTAASTTDDLTAHADLTGLGAVTITDDGAGRSSVRMTITPPSALTAALELEDAAATEQLLTNTFVEIHLTAGNVHAVTGLTSSTDPQLDVATDNDSVTVRRRVDSLAAGEITAVVSPAHGPPILPLAAAAVAIAAAAGVWLVRRRTTRSEPGPRTLPR
jgi:hypothetical protein